MTIFLRSPAKLETTRSRRESHEIADGSNGRSARDDKERKRGAVEGNDDDDDDDAGRRRGKDNLFFFIIKANYCFLTFNKTESK